jgi:nucleotide-binding universal stress UspA family protein
VVRFVGQNHGVLTKRFYDGFIICEGVAYMDQQYNNILAPVDGSKATDPVLDKAIEVAKLNDTHLDILNVLEVNQFSDTYGGAVSGDVIYKLSEDVQARLNELKQKALDAGVKSVDIHP